MANAVCVFTIFLRSTKKGTYDKDKIYVGDITPELVDNYIEWRREIKQNSDETINHALTPIQKACAYASELGMIEEPQDNDFSIPEDWHMSVKTLEAYYHQAIFVC